MPMTGAQVRALRKKMGWSQADLAKAVGVARNSVARWERNELGIRESAARLMKLLAAQKKK
jgi:transcriptional regulator with XRE-family HTH domain